MCNTDMKMFSTAASQFAAQQTLHQITVADSAIQAKSTSKEYLPLGEAVSITKTTQANAAEDTKYFVGARRSWPQQFKDALTRRMFSLPVG
jgi:hypothetical protein